MVTVVEKFNGGNIFKIDSHIKCRELLEILVDPEITKFDEDGEMLRLFERIQITLNSMGTDNLSYLLIFEPENLYINITAENVYYIPLNKPLNKLIEIELFNAEHIDQVTQDKSQQIRNYFETLLKESKNKQMILKLFQWVFKFDSEITKEEKEEEGIVPLYSVETAKKFEKENISIEAIVEDGDLFDKLIELFSWVVAISEENNISDEITDFAKKVFSDLKISPYPDDDFDRVYVIDLETNKII